jgi:PHP domain-containing protein
VRTIAAIALAVVSWGLLQPRGAPATETIRRHFTQADRERGRYQYVPVRVRDGVTRLTIAYRYDAADGASVIDLGLFEPGSLELGTRAFRGYSGGAVRSITIERDHATPGYRPGSIPAGEWHVLLGLYKVAAAGVDVDIDITTSAEPQRDAAPQSVMLSFPEPAIDVGPRWFAGALHLHTNHSDGTIGPNAVAAAAREAGVAFIAITDHNNTTHRLEPIESHAPLRIVGEEITTPAGHANVWGLRPGAWIDFRISPNDPGAAGIVNGFVEAAHRDGALFSINHPDGDCGGCAWEQVIPTGLDAIEIWNRAAGPQERAVALWDRLLQSGRHVTAVGASDWHRAPDRLDGASVRVLANALTERDVLDAIRGGRVVVIRSAADEPPVLDARCRSQRAAIGDTLTCGPEDLVTIDVAPETATPRRGSREPIATEGGGPVARVDLVWNGVRIESARGLPATFGFRRLGSGYARIQTYAADGSAIAITNPVYVAIH